MAAFPPVANIPAPRIAPSAPFYFRPRVATLPCQHGIHLILGSPRFKSTNRRSRSQVDHIRKPSSRPHIRPPFNCVPSKSCISTSAWLSSADHQDPKMTSTRANKGGEDWEDSIDFAIKSFEELPHRLFGLNQHMIINYELKETLRIMLRQFNAPIVYCFAYGSGVFPQDSQKRNITDAEFRSVHPHPPEALIKSQKGSPKMIDFIFGVSHTQHWHSINMRQHRNHYSGIASLGSAFVSRVQGWGAGVYFNPFILMNGMLIKYGVTSIDNLVKDLSTWDNLYLAGRLQKPVKILRDHPQVRLANQHNLIAAVRTALLILPPEFSETELYGTIAGLSYLGDPRMALPTESKSKVSNIVNHNIAHFRRLYAPLIKTLPNVDFISPMRLHDEDWLLDPVSNNKLQQSLDPVKRSNMVRRLPKHFGDRLYFQYQKHFNFSREEFSRMMQATSKERRLGRRCQGGEFDKMIALDSSKQLQSTVRRVIKQTVNWPSTTQSMKGLLTAGWKRAFRYLRDKYRKWSKG